MSSFLATETGTVKKKWKGRLPAALIYPNSYPLAVSNLGFQLVYSLLNDHECIVCERFVYPFSNAPLRSLESNRPLSDFVLVLASVSFEHDYPRLVGMLAAGGLKLLAADRAAEIGAGSPLVIFGGVAVFMNPEPLAPFADLMVIGEAEPVLPDLMERLIKTCAAGARRFDLLRELAVTVRGCYVPALYSFQYGDQGVVEAIIPEPDVPARVDKVVQGHMDIAAYSRQLSPEAELGMFMTELGRGCSRGCRFCAAGFIYRPPRLWSAEGIIAGLRHRPDGLKRIGLLGMEMAEPGVLDSVSEYLAEQGCSLSFSSLRADRITGRLLSLLAGSELRSAAIAPDGCSERLRRVINKGLTEKDLLSAAEALVGAGIVHLKLYVMIGLPTETDADLDEMAALIRSLQERILPIGRKRGRVTKMTLSVNSFVPKPWTPFQYVSFGGLSREQAAACLDETASVMALKGKIKYLRRKLTNIANLRMKTDQPERVLQQAVFSRGDRRLAPALIDMAVHALSFKRAMKAHGLTAWEYAVRPRDQDELFCWDIIDHGIQKQYLWQEYLKSVSEKPTTACDTGRCRSCGVCREHGAPVTDCT